MYVSILHTLSCDIPHYTAIQVTFLFDFMLFINYLLVIYLLFINLKIWPTYNHIFNCISYKWTYLSIYPTYYI